MFTHSPENHGWLRTKWQALVTSVAADRTASDAVWDELILHYSEPHRSYHNLSHIMVMLRCAEKYRHQIKRPETVAFAIWFHDVICDTHIKDSERRSAEWARRAMLGMQISEHYVQPVLECILATERHEVGVSRVADLPLFLDIDLTILGASANIYKAYSQVIRAEYQWMPIDRYRIARSQFLRRFLDRPALYLTSGMAAELEHQARINLASELAELSHN